MWLRMSSVAPWALRPTAGLMQRRYVMTQLRQSALAVGPHVPIGLMMHGPGRAAQVLEKNSGNTKALYRRAQAHMAAGDYVEAEVDIKAALQVPSWAKCIYAVVYG